MMALPLGLHKGPLVISLGGAPREEMAPLSLRPRKVAAIRSIRLARDRQRAPRAVGNHNFMVKDGGVDAHP